METYLTNAFQLIKGQLPKGKLSRWAEVRPLFGINAPLQNWPATKAIWALKDAGEKTRTQWEQEYRHQRKLAAIQNGTDYEPPTEDEEPFNI